MFNIDDKLGWADAHLPNRFKIPNKEIGIQNKPQTKDS